MTLTCPTLDSRGMEKPSPKFTCFHVKSKSIPIIAISCSFQPSSTHNKMKMDLSNPKSNGGPLVQLRTGQRMPLVGLGTYKIVGTQAMDSAVDAALACGYRQFDTAKLYKNEPELGAALEKFLPKYGLRREDVFITTKIFPFPPGEAAEEVPKLVEQSLDNLRTSYLDLLLIHYPKPAESADEDGPGNATSRRECWQALEQISENTLRSIGVSNYECRHLDELKALYTTESGRRRPAVNQVEFHPHFRRADIRAWCEREDVFFQAFSSLARQNPALLTDPVMVGLVEKYKTTAQNVLLAFATSQGVGIVPKSASAERIRANFDCVDLKLAEEDLNALNTIPVDQHYIRTTPWLVQ